MSRPTAEERVREYEVTLFRSNQPRMDGTSNYAPTRAVTKSHARIIAEAHAAAAVDEVRTRAEKAEARVAELKAEVEQLKNERHELRGEVHVLTEQLLGAKSEVAHLEQELEVCQDGEREREQELEREVERLRDLLRRVRDPFAANGEVAAGEGIGAVYEALLAEIDALGPQAPPAPKGVHP